MKDIPVFTTENGVASLTLKEIPDSQRAYIKLQSSAEPEKLLTDCVEFCRACGAEQIFASGEHIPETYPVTATLVRLRAEGLGQSDACLFPVTEETVGQWRSLYNQRMAGVPNAAHMNKTDEKQLLADGDCYFVHRGGALLGIGKASGNTVEMIASLQKGCGEAVLLALASVLEEGVVSLVVAKENRPAMALYERLGFTPVAEVSRWYQIM